VLSQANPSFNFLVSLVDNYGDHGIIGLVCARSISQEALFLDTFLMSCRVLGRHLESWMLHQLIQRASLLGYKYLVGEYIPSERNAMVSEFLVKHNFRGLENYANLIAISESATQSTRHTKPLVFEIGVSQIPNIDLFN
jgi:FkbH-like protein